MEFKTANPAQPAVGMVLMSLDNTGEAVPASAGDPIPTSVAVSVTVGTVTGKDADAAVPTGNPVLVAGWDATDVRTLLTDIAGQLLTIATGAAADGAAVSGNPLLVAGSDGTDVRTLNTDATGHLQVVAIATGAAADAAAVAGNPVLTAGSDGTDARTLTTDTGGHLVVTSLGASAYNTAANTAGHAVKTGAGVWRGFTTNTAGTTTTAAVYDGISNAGVLLATIDTSTLASLRYDIAFATGLFIVLAGAIAADVTVSYQ